jgi:hypothetical protein
VYAREFPDLDEPLTFGVSGKLIKNALVMYDRQTDTLWSQFLGVAVDGELAGTALVPVGGLITTWSEWREAHPQTLVLDQGSRQNDPYAGYYRSGNRGVLGVDNRDERFETKEFVLSVQEPGTVPRAYPYRWLNDQPVVNDLVGDIEIVVVFDTTTGASDAFRRNVGGQMLSFDADPDRPGLFRDRETGSTWSLVAGRAVEGPMAGTTLERVNALPVFWFAWADFFPGGEVWQPANE